MAGRLRVPAALQRWSAIGYDFETMVHDLTIFVQFFTFFDVSSISIDCPARCNFDDQNDYLYDPHTHRL